MTSSPSDPDRLLEQAMAAGDVDSLVALYEENAVFAVTGQVQTRSATELRAAFAAVATSRPHIKTNPRVLADFGDVAVIYNDWNETGTDDQGKPFERSGKAIEVVRRQPDGSWKFLFDDPYARG